MPEVKWCLANDCTSSWPGRLGSRIPATFWSSAAPICSSKVPMLLMPSHVVPVLACFHCFSGATASFPFLYHHNSEAVRPQFYRWLLRMWGDVSGIFLSTFPLLHFLLYLAPGWWECLSAASLALIPQLLIVKKEFEYGPHCEWGHYLITTFPLVLVTLTMSKPKIQGLTNAFWFWSKNLSLHVHTHCWFLSQTEIRVFEIGFCGWWENVSADSNG